MQQDVVADFTYDLTPVRHPEYQILAVDGDQVRARVNAVSYAWSGVDEDLPETGWDVALGMAFRPEMPVHVSVDNDYAVYVEPNVWIVHETGLESTSA